MRIDDPVVSMQIPVAGGRLQVEEPLFDCVEAIASAAGVTPAVAWDALADIVNKFGARNKALLEERDDIQAQLDTWYMQRVGHQAFDIEEHMAFLTEIGYLVPDGPAFSVSTSNVDPEIASMAGPQLVCPVGE